MEFELKLRKEDDYEPNKIAVEISLAPVKSKPALVH